MKRTLAALFLLALGPAAAVADSNPQTIPFVQNWSDIGLITANDNWSGVPGIEGFRGDNLTPGTGTDPQTVLDGDAAPVLDVNANQTNPETFTTGGATEFHLTDPVVALAGSGTADAPYLRLYLNTTGEAGVTIRYTLRDIELVDNAIQPVALHYRVGGVGSFTNLGGGFVADATDAGATLESEVCAVLPVDAENQPLVQVRILTTNAVGNDEWVGVDDIVVDTAGCGGGLPALSIGDVTVLEGDSGTVDAVFTVSLSDPAGVGGVTFDVATQDDTATIADDDYEANALTGQVIPEGEDEYTFTVTVNGDLDPEPNETLLGERDQRRRRYDLRPAGVRQRSPTTT